MILGELLEEIFKDEEYASLVYERIAAVNEEDIKATALTFVKEEKDHSKVIQSIIELGEGLENPVPEEVVLKLKMSKKEGKDASLDLAGASRKQLFHYALQMEKDSIAQYEDIARCFDSETMGRQQFEKLAKDERNHMYFILKKLHELK